MTAASLAPLIQQILPRLAPAAAYSTNNSAASASVEALLTQLATAMAPTVDSLINQLIPLKASKGNALLDATTRSNLVKAVVLNSTQLTAAKENKNSNTPPQYRINVSAGKQQLELTTSLPIPTGTRITLNIAQNNLATIISIDDQSSSKPNSANPEQVRTNLQAQLTNQQVKGTLAASPANTTATADKPSSNTQTAAQQNRSTIEHSLRQVLPQQQALKLLLPLLQQLTSTANSPRTNTAFPKELNQQLSALLKQFPTAEQIQQPKALKQSINNSGVFLESKLLKVLAQQLAANAANKSTTSTPTTNATNNPATAINQDVKALLLRIIPSIEKAQAENTTSAKPATAPQIANSLLPSSSLLHSQTSSPQNSSEEAKAQLLGQVAAELNVAPAPTTSEGAAASKNQNLDVLLRQLSNQLLAGLARTQMNQLETLSARQANTPDAPAPANSWTLELPIIHGKNVDNLELRIDQYDIDDKENSDNNAAQKQWTVMLAFDLHSLGKMSVQLKIVGASVSATVWSQLEATHKTVKQEVGELRKNLEKIGVQVKQVDCQLGTPPKTTLPLYKQLVDVHT